MNIPAHLSAKSATSSTDRNRIANAYVDAFTRNGARHYIGNLDTQIDSYHWGDHALPLTVNDGFAGESFICSPRNGYIDYTLEELQNFPNRRAIPLLQGVVRGVGGLLALSDIDRVVHVNNWMISTNLPVALDPALARTARDALVARYPQHFIAMRSLTQHYDAPLIAALRDAGWVMVPSRQVFVIDDIARDGMPRRDMKRDEVLRQKTGLSYDEPDQLSASDAARMAELYRQLYIQKYSQLNPVYTPAFFAMSHAIGMIRYLVWRDAAGVIQAMGGMHHLGKHAAMPMLGYNTAADQQLGLYRLAFHAGSRYAMRHRALFNMSSGATGFKRNRGAVAKMEFTAFYLRHLPAHRRYPFSLLHRVADRIGAPLLEKYQL